MAPTTLNEPQPQPSIKALSVLVIDDNPADQELAIIYLGKAWPFESEMHVETALDGLEALDKMRTTRFCLILLDWRLPRGGSGHVLYEIRHNGVFVPVVVMTGLERDELPGNLETLGAAYINKQNLDASSLYCAIAEALRNCRILCQPPVQPDRGTGAILFHSHSPHSVCG